jgi:hypothetical protein
LIRAAHPAPLTGKPFSDLGDWHLNYRTPRSRRYRKAIPPLMRQYFILLLLLLSAGCVTVVVPLDGSDPGSMARRTLTRAQRVAEVQQAELRRESLDALATTAVRIASDVQAWALKPAAFGGGDGGLSGVTFEQLGYPTQNGHYHTPDGVFRLAQDGDAVLVQGEGHVFGHVVIARVAGVGWRDLSLTIQSR